MLLEEIFFNSSQVAQQDIDFREVELTCTFGEVATQTWQRILVHEQQRI